MRKILTKLFLKFGLRGMEITLINGFAFGFMMSNDFKEWQILIGVFGISLYFFEDAN